MLAVADLVVSATLVAVTVTLADATIGDGAVCTINALSPSVHSGESAMNYGRKGHIKGSNNVPYAALLGADGAYRDDEGLRELFAAVGAFDRAKVICYCSFKIFGQIPVGDQLPTRLAVIHAEQTAFNVEDGCG